MTKHCSTIVPPSNSASQVSKADEHNMGDKVTATPTPKSPMATSHHPNIMFNNPIQLQEVKNER